MGAIALTAALRLLRAPLERPPQWVRTVGRVVVGLSIGVAVTPETLRTIARAQASTMVIILGLLMLGLGTGVLISRLTSMPLPTALCSASPGALSAMVALADDLGGDGPVVASMHLVRLLSVSLIMPLLVSGRFVEAADPASVTGAAAALPPGWQLVLLLCAGLAVAWLLVKAGVPAGDLLAGVVAAAIAGNLFGVVAVPAHWRFLALVVVAADIGATMSRDALSSFRPFALAGALMTVFLIVSGLTMGWVMAQISPLDMATAILGSAPGGADTMMILAGEFEADQPLVTAMHTSRMITLTLVLPLVVRVARAGAQRAQEQSPVVPSTSYGE